MGCNGLLPAVRKAYGSWVKNTKLPVEVLMKDLAKLFNVRLLVVDAAAACYTCMRDGKSKGMATQLMVAIIDFLMTEPEECRVHIVWDAVVRDFENKLVSDHVGKKIKI